MVFEPDLGSTTLTLNIELNSVISIGYHHHRLLRQMAAQVHTVHKIHIH